MTDLTTVLNRYVGAWNEADPAARLAAVSRLYASRSRVVTPHHDVLGADAVVEHIRGVFTEFVGSSARRFRCAAATGHHRNLLLRWELAGDGRVTGSGINVLFFGPDGRIEADHQFSEPKPYIGNGVVGS